MMNNIKITEKSDTVEVHLSDGRTLRGPRGTSVEDFLLGISPNPDKPIVAAVLNKDLRELGFKIETESTLHPVTPDPADGARIYRRSLTFLREYA